MTSDRRHSDLRLEAHDRLRKELLARPASSEAASIPVPPVELPPLLEPEPRRRKPSRIFHPRKAKQDLPYDRAEVMRLYDVSRNTVGNWIKQGLVCVPGKPTLFRGRDLNEFHRERHAKARRRCAPGEFLCFHCKKVTSLTGRTAEIEWRDDRAGTLRWRCSLCSKPNETYQSRSQAEALERIGVKLTSGEADYEPARLRGEIVQNRPKLEDIHEPGE